MWIQVVCPAPPGSRVGNRVTARRWARILADLGHRVAIVDRYRGARCDLLVALHARQSADSIAAFRAGRPAAHLVVALTGTDLYEDLPRDADARRSIDLADRLVVLQPLARSALPRTVRSKVRVIYQSVVPPARAHQPAKGGSFDVVLLAHLRAVKDPFRAEEAVRGLPASSRLRVLHAGGARDPALAESARAREVENGRYRWLGELPRGRALRLLARSQALLLPSILEGGANVVSEAIAVGVPVIASRIPGSEGLLGRRYPGFFPVGDTAALRELLVRFERDERFHERLRIACTRRQPLVDPLRERASWARLVAELTRSARPARARRSRPATSAKRSGGRGSAPAADRPPRG